MVFVVGMKYRPNRERIEQRLKEEEKQRLEKTAQGIMEQ